MQNQEEKTSELPTKATFYYQQSYNFPQTSRSFYDAVKFCFETPGLKEFTPIKVVLEEEGKTLYFDERLFGAYIAESITYEQLIEATECDCLLRNIREFELSTGENISHGSLWKKKGDEIILIDDDQYICIELPASNFIQV